MKVIERQYAIQADTGTDEEEEKQSCIYYRYSFKIFIHKQNLGIRDEIGSFMMFG